MADRHNFLSTMVVVADAGVAEPFQDVLTRVAHGSCGAAAGSLLLLGPPGVGTLPRSSINALLVGWMIDCLSGLVPD